MVDSAHHRLVRTRRPSFHHELCRLHRSYRRGFPAGDPVFRWETKSGGRGVARSVGVEAPRILQGPCPAVSIDWDALPNRFVLKPDWESSANGVFVLSRRGDAFYDVLGCRTLVRSAILEDLIARGPVIAEEVVGDTEQVPDDWKFYAFQGRLELVLQLRRSPTRRYRYYLPDWTDAGPVHYGRKPDPHLAPPLHGREQLIKAAQRLSTAVEVPFVRVDLYQRDDGSVLFGELTPRPGVGHRFRRPIDTSMGEAWETAGVAP